MAARYQHRSTSTAGAAPGAAGLLEAEIGVNIADGRLFTKAGSAVKTIRNSDDNDARYVRHDTAAQGLNATQQGNARGNISAQQALGYTPVNKAGDTMTGGLAATGLSVNGTGGTTSPIRMRPWGPSDEAQKGDVYVETSPQVAVVLNPTNNAASQNAYHLFRSNGSASIPGALSKGSGTFLIDHPLDPLNRNLRHGFVEAPRYELIYRGVVRLVEGVATVDIDLASNMTEGTFAALTANAVVASLQNQTGFARVRPGAITGGTFQVICEDAASADDIAWMVIAERNDPFVRSDMDHNCDSAGRFVPEFDKPEPPYAVD